MAVLGFALNDSGITIPGMMAAVIESAVVVLLARAGVPHRADRARRRRAAARAQRSNRAAIRDRVVAFLVGLVTVRFLRMVSGDILVVARAASAATTAATGSPTAGGLFIVLTVLVIEAGRVGARRARRRVRSRASPQARSEVLFAVFGFGFLGLVDDLAAVGEDRGFKGHLGALPRGPRHHRAAQAASAARRWPS